MSEKERAISDLEVEQYRLAGGGPYDVEDVVLIRARQLEGPDRWKIKNRAFVMDKKGRWILEPIPSERTKGYLNKVRWESAEEALRFYEQHQPPQARERG